MNRYLLPTAAIVIGGCVLYVQYRHGLWEPVFKKRPSKDDDHDQPPSPKGDDHDQPPSQKGDDHDQPPSQKGDDHDQPPSQKGDDHDQPPSQKGDDHEQPGESDSALLYFENNYGLREPALPTLPSPEDIQLPTVNISSPQGVPLFITEPLPVNYWEHHSWQTPISPPTVENAPSADLAGRAMCVLVLSVCCLLVFLYVKITRTKRAELDIREARMADREAQLNDRQAELAVLKAQLNNRQAELDHRDKQQNDRQTEQDNRDDQLNHRQAELTELERKLAGRETQLDHRDKQQNDRQTEQDNRANQLDNRQAELAELARKLAGRETQLDHRHKQQNDRQTEQDNRDDQLNDRQAEQDNRDDRQNDRQTELDNRDKQQNDRQTELGNRDDQLNHRQAELAKLERKLAGRETQLDHRDKQQNDRQTEQDNRDDQLNDRQAELAQLERELAGREAEFRRHKAERQLEQNCCQATQHQTAQREQDSHETECRQLEQDRRQATQRQTTQREQDGHQAKRRQFGQDRCEAEQNARPAEQETCQDPNEAKRLPIKAENKELRKEKKALCKAGKQDELLGEHSGANPAVLSEDELQRLAQKYKNLVSMRNRKKIRWLAKNGNLDEFVLPELTEEEDLARRCKNFVENRRYRDNHRPGRLERRLERRARDALSGEDPLLGKQRPKGSRELGRAKPSERRHTSLSGKMGAGLPLQERCGRRLATNKTPEGETAL